MKPSILMVSSEASPYAKSGGLADVLEALPRALAKLGHDVAVVIPRYKAALDAPARRVIDYLPISLGAHHYGAAVYQTEAHGVTFYFVDQPWLFGDRAGLYGDRNGDFADNHVRFALLARAAIEIARRLFKTDIFHCHDWQSALIPAYLKNPNIVDPTLVGARTLLTIHNLGYQGRFPDTALAETGLPASLFHPGAMEFWGGINYLKTGIVFADALTTVSPTYAEEIQTPEYGCALEGVIRDRKSALTGILNGVDYERWDPTADTLIPAHFSPTDLTGKLECKRDLIRTMGLPESAIDKPLLGIVSRFAWQKGFDLLAEAAHAIFEQGFCLAALGSGEPAIEGIFGDLQARYPDQVSVRFGYDESLAHRIEAGADLFLMPSRYEPCGLNQIYSLRYGTVPVVRATGGLDDTITSSPPGEATGFKFHVYNGEALLGAVQEARRLYEDQAAWKAMMVRGMLKDFSWAAAAGEYSRLYSSLG